MNEYHFYRNTKFRCHSEQEADLMDSCEEGRKAIEFEQFIPNIAPEDWNEVTENLGYDDELKPEDDWSVAYFTSEYGGLPCFIFSTTECDFIFLKREDAKILLEQYATSDKPEWGRDTRFGKGGTDPQHGYFED